MVTQIIKSAAKNAGILKNVSAHTLISHSYVSSLLEHGVNLLTTTMVVLQACRLIDVSNGNLSMEMLAKRMYLTPRVLQYKFQEQIGLAPKMYSRIIRFNKILKELAVNSLTDWQEIAINYNYCDQAHLIHDFKFFSENSPAHQLKIRGIIN